MTNNDVFKKLRILFPINDEHLEDIFSGAISKSQMLGWHVSQDNRKFRAMTDRELEMILDYLIEKYRRKNNVPHQKIHRPH